MADIPPALRRELPPEAQRAYRQAYRDARDQGVDEAGARIAAQEAVEEQFRRVGDAWVARTRAPTGGPPYGEEAIARIVAQARFPCTAGQLVQQTGDPIIEIAPGEPLALADILDLVEGGYWREPNELLEGVHAAWRKVRMRGAEVADALAAEGPA